MDLFEEWLNKKDTSKWVKRALTDPSFNNYRANGVTKRAPDYEAKHTPLPVNTDLATYGDAVIKFCYSALLLDTTKQLTEDKKKVECDKYLVDTVARHYKLLSYIDKDPRNRELPDDYDYESHGGTNKNPCKYIATAVEAMVGAIFQETRNLSGIIGLLDSWLHWNIDFQGFEK